MSGATLNPPSQDTSPTLGFGILVLDLGVGFEGSGGLEFEVRDYILGSIFSCFGFRVNGSGFGGRIAM